MDESEGGASSFMRRHTVLILVLLSAKTLCSWVVQDASSAAQAGESFDLQHLWPLLVLASVLIIGSIIRRRMILNSKAPF
jgi:hypothetical protein